MSTYQNTGRNGKKPTPPIIWVLVAAIAVLLALLIYFLAKPQPKPYPAVTPTAKPAASSSHVHSWAEATCERPATCTLCGKTKGSALGHSWVAATYDRPRHCSVCGKEEGSVLSPTPTPKKDEWPPYPLASTNIVPPSGSSYWLSTPQRRIVTAPKGAYQFAAPDDYAERFSTVDKGTVVEMLAQEGEYGLCLYRGQILGWIRVKWLDPA